MAGLENGAYGFAFSSGMAAISTLLMLFKPGQHVILSDDIYGGTYRICEEIFKNYGLEFSYTDTSSIAEVERAFKSNTCAVFAETPTNPTMKVSDIGQIAELAKSNNALTIIDNTFLTPYFQRPLDLGADVVVHSGTKYLAGHNDTLAGFIAVNDCNIAEKLKLVQKSQGAVLAPFDSWLVLRGIKTLGVRLEKQQENAIKVANWLCSHKKIERVYYVGLPEHEAYELSRRQASGFGAMISFSVAEAEYAGRVLEKLKLIMFAESLGGVESLITYPVVQTHSAIPQEIREKTGVNDRLLRLSVGIEAADDIIADLEQALE